MLTVPERPRPVNAHSHRARQASSPEDVVISVAALLRREGRGPHAADGRLRPRRCYRIAPEPHMHAAQNVRKATAATCALFAAGALFGVSVLDDPSAMPRAGANVPTDRPGRLPAYPRIGAAPPAGASTLALAAASAVDVPAITALGVPVRPAARAGSGGPAPFVGVPRQRQVPTPVGGYTPGGLVGAGGSPGPVGGPADEPPSGAGPTVDPPSGGTAQHPPAGGGGVDVPDLPDPPKVEVPPVTVPDVPVVGTVTAPGVAISGGKVDPPGVSVAADKGTVAVSTSKAEARVPDVEASGAAVGPVRTSKAKVTTPDVSVSPGRVALGAEPDVDLPEVKVSKTEIETPDVEVAGKSVELPDVDVSEVKVDGDDPVGSVVDTVGGLLGKDSDEMAEQDGDTEEASDTTSESSEKSDDEAVDDK
jgi:hypothetical protein